ncbi:Fur family transcriptional regulator [Acaryochloris sp. IP29b_bin.148]|uniref:Fur family transcriptional regulator n=1 Tax=Acaryochloris sp. IP29b_bin.148 TaxID=2969218 RepID=UPI0026298B84|nr:Fur family transcriptional regulator [Acaryochloris sp. IP29b_bin.148]
MQQQADSIIQTLKAKGVRVTPQRFAVYADLLARSDHPTAEQLLSDLNQNAPTSSQATIYKTLQALRDVGLVREVLLEEGVCRYDANIGLHHHFRCQACGEVEDIPWEQFQAPNFQGLRSELQVKSYEITVHGYCECCHTDE